MMGHASSLDARLPTQVVMVGLGDEVFALEASMVREILDPVPTTRVAGAQDFVPSVINVRGNVIPLADLRVRFGMKLRPDTPNTRTVVIEVPIGGDPVVVGIVADKVYEVTEITLDQSQPVPRVGTNWKPEFIRHIVRWNDHFVIVPDIATVLS